MGCGVPVYFRLLMQMKADSKPHHEFTAGQGSKPPLSSGRESPASEPGASAFVPGAIPSSTTAWSTTTKLLVSFLLAIYLFIVIMGPVTNPIYTEELTGPLGRALAPAHQALYLGHGYRFFAPDPGPSHLLVYRVTRADGSTVDGRFPDKDTIWPRLMYHRWFMLSETIFEEHRGLPPTQETDAARTAAMGKDVLLLDQKAIQEDFAASQKNLKDQIELFIQQGALGLARQLQQIHARNERGYVVGEQRRKLLVDAVGRELLRRHKGQHVTLFLQERAIALPSDVVLKTKLTDPRYLSELILIGEVQEQH